MLIQKRSANINALLFLNKIDDMVFCMDNSMEDIVGMEGKKDNDYSLDKLHYQEIHLKIRLRMGNQNLKSHHIHDKNLTY